MTARRFALSLAEKDTGTNWVHTGTGIVFRIDPADRAPNVCPCCGRLVLFGDHAFAGTEDAYCLGCYTWGDDSKISCDPNHTTHPNPWTVSPMNARWSMEITIDWGDQTGHDIRYSAHRTAHELWDDEDNALIAWPGLSRDQILSVEIKEI